MDAQILLTNFYAGIIKFYNSGFFVTVKILLGIYTAVLFIDLILLLVQRGVAGNIREGFTGMDVPIMLTKKKNKARKQWQEIRQKLASDNENEYKIAVIEADKFIGDLVAGLGYPGDNFGERLDNINEGQIANIEGLRQAHATRNRIVHDDDFVLEKQEVEGVISQYEEFLRSYQIID